VLPPDNIIFTPAKSGIPYGSGGYDISCWAAFRSGEYHFPGDKDDMEFTSSFEETITYSTLNITYLESNCTKYMKKASPDEDFSKELPPDTLTSRGIGNCILGTGVSCQLLDPQGPRCRLNVRYQAAIILTGCLTIKALYMVFVNLRARNKAKKSCLTFGDVVVASALDPNLQVRNECLVNAGDGYRYAFRNAKGRNMRSRSR
jgi:hypothetical protein